MAETIDKIRVKREIHPNSLKNLKPVQKGEIRNPKGRPKNEECLTALVKKYADVEADKRYIHPDDYGKSNKEVLAKSIWIGAIKLMPAVLIELWNRTDGKVLDTVDMNVTGGLVVDFQIGKGQSVKPGEPE